MKKYLVIGLVLGFVGTQVALAKRNNSNQGQRIKQGKQSGEITRRESRNLRQDKRELRSAKKRAMSDGEITGKEKRRLKNIKQDFKQDVYQAKNNDKNYDLNDDGKFGKKERKMARKKRKHMKRKHAKNGEEGSGQTPVEDNSPSEGEI